MRTAATASSLLALLSSLSLASAFFLQQQQPFRSLAQGSVRMMAVSAPKGSYDITLLPGDGIGPEIMGATVRACV
jgi:hypothetical protein